MIYDVTRPFFYQFLSDYSWNLFEEKMRMRGKGSGTFLVIMMILIQKIKIL